MFHPHVTALRIVDSYSVIYLDRTEAETRLSL